MNVGVCFFLFRVVGVGGGGRGGLAWLDLFFVKVFLEIRLRL